MSPCECLALPVLGLQIRHLSLHFGLSLGHFEDVNNVCFQSG